MESDSATTPNIHLSINYLKNVDVNELCFENMNKEIIELLKQLFSNGDVGGEGSDNVETLAKEERMEIFNQVSALKHKKVF